MKNYSRANTGIDLNLIPVFIEVVRCGSMAKASLRLEMSRPAVSLALKRFNQLFDEPLFFRKGLYLEPTEKALALTSSLEILMGDIHDNIAAVNYGKNKTPEQNVPGLGNIMQRSESSL
ncbi:helix-turn-helix domain-containing protein [Enterobacter asburiae]|uniref:helix-turn-helix domain-containing protein n=1 Tax=Enterobacter asburiae TaxID=61645 RepID=UPI000FEBE222|nr:LysR family transcriptional regulator [Enterobacter asburiae]ELW9469683.1 LysR family transcriptional regulator [Enterobacter asburiae]MDC6393746.1 LysR family transcriptional regulator [Enterobacter asburiae]MDC6402247.1 LysR family transcriptional regulator [Enterobacter asburiae]MDG9839285.1 LysR family transcriptional regulator [Enterobacter asburiae]QLV57846.1 LysR family transcriptional regulator [Enterobacter asburiae]